MNVKKITSSTDAVLSGKYRIVGVKLVAAGDAATAILWDALTYVAATGEFCKLSASATLLTDNEHWEMSEGIMTDNGLSVTITGTTPSLFVYYI